MDCTKTCDNGRLCTCGQIGPALYKWIDRDIRAYRILSLGKAKPGETISSAAYRADVEQGRIIGKIARRVIDFFALVIFKQADHCKLSYYWQINIYQPTEQQPTP